MSDSPHPLVTLVHADRSPEDSFGSPRGIDRAPRVPRVPRAPALYVLGWESSGRTTPVAFRLPCPPALDGAFGAAAAERRVRKAYFATLDALRTGRVDDAAEARLARLTREVRSPAARRALQPLLRAQRFVRTAAAGWPVIAAPRTSLARLAVTVPPGDTMLPDAVLAGRYGWALDWMRMHRWVAGRGLVLEWRRSGADPVRDERRAA